MKCNKVIVLLVSWALVVGFSAPAFAGIVEPECELTIEINALRGGSPHVTSGAVKNITSKARIQKGTVPGDTTITDTVLTITAYSGDISKDIAIAPELLTLVVGKGGQGDKLGLTVSCSPGEIIDYVSHFRGTAPNGALCEATSGRMSKTCK